MTGRLALLGATVLLALTVLVFTADTAPSEILRTAEASAQGSASVTMPVPDGATYAIATVTAYSSDGSKVRPRIRDDVGGWWDGPFRDGSSAVTKERALPPEAEVITFIAHAPDAPASTVKVEITFTLAGG